MAHNSANLVLRHAASMSSALTIDISLCQTLWTGPQKSSLLLVVRMTQYQCRHCSSLVFDARNFTIGQPKRRHRVSAGSEKVVRSTHALLGASKSNSPASDVMDGSGRTSRHELLNVQTQSESNPFEISSIAFYCRSSKNLRYASCTKNNSTGSTPLFTITFTLVIPELSRFYLL